MRTATFVSVIALALAAAPGTFAQAPSATPTPRAPSTAVSDTDIETFASIYVDLLETASKYQAEMQSARTDEQALEIRTRAQSESVAKVEKRGWTPDKFNSVSEANNAGPALAEKAAQLIETR